MSREGTLRGDYLEEFLFKTGRIDLSVNVNTKAELFLARGLATGMKVDGTPRVR
jgi:hypothetical protein